MRVRYFCLNLDFEKLPPYDKNMLKKIFFLPIGTERLILRPLRESDAAPLATLANDLRVAANLATLPYPYTQEDAHTFITQSQENLEKGLSLDLAIERREDKTLLGGIGYRKELGYWIGHKFWGEGYTKEAARSFVRFLFCVLEMDSLVGSARKDNLASRRIFEGLGFRETGTKECTSLACKGIFPGVIYALTRQEFIDHYKKGRPPLMEVSIAFLLDKDGKVFLAHRPLGKDMPGVWEFPGGKIEEGETPELAMVREVKEETGIDVDIKDLESLGTLLYPYEAYEVKISCFLCRQWNGTPYGAEGQKTTWAPYRDLGTFCFFPAAIPLLQRLGEELKEKNILS